MSLPGQDSFTQADSTDIASYGAPDWNGNVGGLYVFSNEVTNWASQSVYRRILESFNDDHETRMTLKLRGTTNGWWLGPAARVDAGGADSCYAFQWGQSATARRRYVKRVTSTTTVLGTDNTTPSADDVFAIRVVGSDISTYINGVAWNSTTDASLGTGDPGIYGTGTSNGSTSGDDWWADDYPYTSLGHPASRRRGREVIGQEGVRIF